MNKVEAIYRAQMCRERMEAIQADIRRLQGHISHAFDQRLSAASTHLSLAIGHLTVDSTLETLLETSIEELERRHHQP